VETIAHPREADPESELASTMPRGLIRVVVLLGCVILAVRIAPLSVRGLRVDENLTAWVTSDSFSDAVSRSYRYQGQSPLYFMGIWLWRQLVGANEFMLRLPSMLATLAILWRIRVFVRGWLSDSGSWLAVGLGAGVLLLGDGPVAARPYVFGALALVIATEHAVRWSENGSLRSGMLWCGASVVALYMHPFVFFAVAGQGALILVTRPELRRQMVVVAATGAALCLPIVPQVLSLGQRQESLVLVDQPSTGQLVFALLQPTLLVPVVVCGAVARFLGTLRPPRLGQIPGAMWVWAVAPQIGVFAYSHLSGSSIFILRYFGFALPALAMITAAILIDLRPPVIALVGLAISVAITVASFLTPIETQWALAAEVVNDRSAGVVFASAGFVEAADADFIRGDAVDYLNAPLLNYGVTGPIEALPLHFDNNNGAFVRGLVQEYRSLERIVVVERVGVRDAINYREELGGLMRTTGGYEFIEAIDDADGLRISVYER